MSAIADLHTEALASWNDNADYWDEGIGHEGNKYWKRLQEPCISRFLGKHLARQDCQALDLATGNGLCARWLADRGASVTAANGSVRMLEKARERSSNTPGITFRTVDVTNAQHFDALVADIGEEVIMSRSSLSESGRLVTSSYMKLTSLPFEIGGFDIVLINMALMNISTLEPLATALPQLLKEDGTFVATLLHPAFFTSDHSRLIDVRTDPETGVREVIRSKAIRKYMEVPPARGVAIPGQPVNQVYFHRPMQELLGVFLKNGLVLDGFEEPTFTSEEQENDRLEATVNYTQLPALMAFRLRRGL